MKKEDFLYAFLAIISIVLFSAILNNNGITGYAIDCEAEWSCGEWSACTAAGIQERFCTDVSNCNLGDKVQTMQCESPLIGELLEQTQTQAINQEQGFQRPSYSGNTDFDSFSAGAIIFVLVLTLFNIAAIFWTFYHIRKSHEALTEEKRSININEHTIKNLHNYVHNKIIHEGHHVNNIQKQLVREGWNKVAISKVVKQIPTKHINNSLAVHIEIMKHFGKDDEDIKLDLKKKGWDKKSVDSAMDKLKKMIEE